MASKYDWLTREILEQDYAELKSFKLLAQKYCIPVAAVKWSCKRFGIKTTPKIRYTCYDDLLTTDTEKSFYVAGFIAADGSINQHRCREPNYVSICLAKADEQHLENIKNILAFTGPIKLSTRKLSEYNKNWNDSEQVRIDIYSKRLINNLKRFGIEGRKSLTYYMPGWLLVHPMVSHFIRGYFDGDGSFYVNKCRRQTRKYGIVEDKKMVFSLRGSEIFLNQVKDFLKLNSVAKPEFNNGIYLLRYSSNSHVSKISKILYTNANIFMNRKFDLVKDIT